MLQQKRRWGFKDAEANSSSMRSKTEFEVTCHTMRFMLSASSCRAKTARGKSDNLPPFSLKQSVSSETPCHEFQLSDRMMERLLALGYQRCDDRDIQHGDCLCAVDHEVRVFGWHHSRELRCQSANGVGHTLRLPNLRAGLFHGSAAQLFLASSQYANRLQS